MTIGQLSFYDQIKILLLKFEYFGDTLTTHFVSSLCAVSSVFFLFAFMYNILVIRVP